MAAEIISTVERRRSWPTGVKLRIIEEALAPGASIAAVADRNGVGRSLLYTWLRLVHDDKMPGTSITPRQTSAFVPIGIEPVSNAPVPEARPDDHPPPPRSPSRGRRAGLVEIARVIKVDECIDPAALAQLVTALDGAGLK